MAMTLLTSELKARRKNLKLSLEQISKDTCISLHHLESLENGRYDELPGGMYARAFLRTYCDILKLDQKEILQRYENEVMTDPEKPVIRQEQFPSTRKIPAVVIWSLIFIVSASGIFLGRDWIATTFSPYFTGSSDRVPNSIDPKPSPAHASSASIVNTDASVNTSESAYLFVPAEIPSIAGAETAVRSVMEKIDAESSTSARTDPRTDPITDPITDQSAVAAVSGDQTMATQLLNLEVATRESCWISVNSDGVLAFSDTLQTDGTRSFTANQEFSLIIGNAGGVILRINGHDIKPLGQTGEVVRLTIDEDSLQDLIDHSTS